MKSDIQRADTFSILPPELRNEVYKSLLVFQTPIQLPGLDGPYPPIVHVNKLIRAEAMAILYRKNTFLYTDKSIGFICFSTFLPESTQVLIESVEMLCENPFTLLYTIDTVGYFFGEPFPRLKTLKIRSTLDLMSLRSIERILWRRGQEKKYDLIGTGMSKRQWDEIVASGEVFESSSEFEAPLFTYLVKSGLEKVVDSLPNLQNLELTGWVENVGGVAVEQIKRRVFDGEGKRTFEDTET
ncbi:MAG: hypothetical protein M1812_006314 [Candelaria pacifica]|nr:MAG: hypothetical protein M1812_006314 [Candelaria pacifica]